MNSPQPTPQPAANRHATALLPDTSTPATENPHARVGFLRHRVSDCIKERYEVLEHLGGGNFGSVYRVRDTVVGNIVACKEMHVLDDPNTAFDERAAALDLFKREALNLATLRHPHIPAAYFEQEAHPSGGAWRICPRCGFDFPAAPKCPDHGTELLKVPSRFYLMMDFVDGPTLEDKVLESGAPLDEKQCLEWIGQIASALQTLHRAGIVHRDVKPDNIKIRASDNAAFLLDFGLTKQVEEAGGYGTAPLSGTTRLGTVGYAPENLQERANPEHRSDIYALGMTLYRCLAARDPQEPAQLAQMRTYSPRYFNPIISPETERLIAIATAPELSWRYQNLDDFLFDLKNIHAPDNAGYKAPPFTFADGSRARNASDLARLVEQKPDETAEYLRNGMFAAWLQQNGFAASARAANEALKKFPAYPQRALEWFRRALYPSGAAGVLPQLQVSPAVLDFGEIPSGASTIATLRVRNTGAGLMWGQIEKEGVPTLNTAPRDQAPPPQASTPLPGLQVAAQWEGNDIQLEITLDSGRVPVGHYNGALLLKTDGQIARVAVSYAVRALELSVEPDALDFGVVPVGEKYTRSIRIKSPHKFSTGSAGRPRGTVYINSHLQGLTAPERFEGESVEITVDASAPGTTAGEYSGAIQLDTNGGRFRIPVTYAVAYSLAHLMAMVLGFTAGGALIFWIARWLYGLVNPAYASGWLLQGSASGLPSLAPYEFGGGAVVFGIMGTLFASQWLAYRIEKNSTRKRRDPTLRPLMGCLFFVFSVPLGWAGTFLLHYLFWGFGDWLLYPLQFGVLAWLPTENAPLAWASLGALCGLVWGAARALTAIGVPWARYIIYIAFPLVFFTLMLNAMLSTG